MLAIFFVVVWVRGFLGFVLRFCRAYLAVLIAVWCDARLVYVSHALIVWEVSGQGVKYVCIYMVALSGPDHARFVRADEAFGVLV